MNLLYSLPNELIIYIYSFDPNHRSNINVVQSQLQNNYLDKVIKLISSKNDQYLNALDETHISLDYVIYNSKIIKEYDYIHITNLLSKYNNCSKNCLRSRIIDKFIASQCSCIQSYIAYSIYGAYVISQRNSSIGMS